MSLLHECIVSLSNKFRSLACCSGHVFRSSFSCEIAYAYAKTPGEGDGNLLQYSCLEDPTDRGAWRAIVHEIALNKMCMHVKKKKKGIGYVIPIVHTLFLFSKVVFFFLMWTIFKVFIDFVTMLLLFYVLALWLQGMWDLSSLTRDRIHTPCPERQTLNY